MFKTTWNKENNDAFNGRDIENITVDCIYLRVGLLQNML